MTKRSLRCIDWRPCERGTLRGFADLFLPSLHLENELGLGRIAREHERTILREQTKLFVNRGHAICFLTSIKNLRLVSGLEAGSMNSTSAS